MNLLGGFFELDHLLSEISSGLQHLWIKFNLAFHSFLCILIQLTIVFIFIFVHFFLEKSVPIKHGHSRNSLFLQLLLII